MNNIKDLESTGKLQDGVYVQLFAVKDHVQYKGKVLNLTEVSTILVNHLMNGIEELWTIK